MAYDDTKWGGLAKIIVDTSTMTVGDTVRVKSITTGTNYDKQVVTVGTPLIWETEIFKDYVKICMVQTINDTPTEIGGVYKTVDYGQTLFINVLDKKTLVGMQSILNSHTELDTYNIGDEITITINDGTVRDWVMQVGAIDLYDSHEVILVSKYLYGNAMSTGYTARNQDYSVSNMYATSNTFYSQIVESDRQFLKDFVGYYGKDSSGGAGIQYTQKVRIANRQEVFGSYSSLFPNSRQFGIFTTASNRIKLNSSGLGSKWWLSEQYTDGTNTSYNYLVNTNGAETQSKATSGNCYILPCFRLTADS